MKVKTEINTDLIINEYQRWPELALLGSKIKVELKKNRYSRLVILGMGGSAAAGDIVSGWSSNKECKEISVFKGYLPIKNFNETLVISCSASGNTEETLEMTSKAKLLGAEIITMSSGGLLKEKSKEWNSFHIEVPKTIAPRFALPFNLTALIRIASECFSLDVKEELEDSIKQMNLVKEETLEKQKSRNNRAISLALLLKNKIPKIFGDRTTFGVALRFKNSLNENSKNHAMAEFIPEVYHNEVEVWNERNKSFIPVILRSTAETEREKARIDKFTTLLEKRSRIVELRGQGNSILSELMTLVYLLDLVSFYLADSKKVDALSTNLIDYMKS